MNREIALRTLNEVIASSLATQSSIGLALDIHPSQVSRIAAGAFKKLDGHAYRVCKYAQTVALRAQADAADTRVPASLEEKLSRIVASQPQVAAALSCLLDAMLIQDQPVPTTGERLR